MTAVPSKPRTEEVAEPAPAPTVKAAVICLRRVSVDTGGRTYLTELLGPLGAQPGLDVTVHVADPAFSVPATCREVRHRLHTSRVAATIAEARLAAALNATRRFDVLLAPLNILPPTWRGPAVVVQHNVLPFERRRREALATRWYRLAATRLSVRRATETLAGSAHLQARLLKKFPRFGGERVRVVPYGVSSALFAEEMSGERPTGERILVVSALWDYKRVDQALRAVASVAARRPSVELVVAGPASPAKRLALTRLASELGVEDRVRFVGNVSHAELAKLYRSAAVLLALSDVEASSLPILEAMAFGLPIVAKRIPAHVEIGGDVPIWVEHDAPVEAIADAIERVLSSETVRGEAARAGRERASAYTWERTAELVAAALRRAAASRASVTASR